jgi:hypothetical protein
MIPASRRDSLFEACARSVLDLALHLDYHRAKCEAFFASNRDRGRALWHEN